MSELVTSAAAISQFNLLASRQQVFGIERAGSAPDEAASTDAAQSAAHTPASANRHEEAPAPSLAQHDGPSRARVEIRSLDLGLTPAEVVGTPDVLQRFDSNGDGRVDLLESDKATLVRQNLFTFAGVGNAAGESEPPPPPPPEPAPVIVNSEGGAAPTEEEAVPGEPKKFFVSVTPDGRPTSQKFADTREAAAGGTTATVAVAKKFYGQGAEIVAGPVVSRAPAAPSLHAKAAVLKQAVIKEDGSGEKRLYDKVPQSEAQHRQSGHAGTSLHEKARQISAAINGSKKTVLVQVATYANASRVKQAAIVVESTDITV